MDVNTEILVNPTAKTITLSAQASGQEKEGFEMILEQIDCNFNNDFTVGGALYTGFIKQKDGSLTKQLIRLEAKDGNLIFFNGDPEKPNELTIYVSKWEIMSDL
ncbi:hypothetical protein [Paraflavitalea speifideaquila]|uniref:hypothetical protein n=1 Tax=Paraflavitalea speifideaquila TaxID=3076558 RepID=UPI0028E1CD13|nr:hypothetical protein [Paraflavitalea speifideiaquila]